MPRRTEPTPAALLPALRTHAWFASCPPALQEALLERSRLVHLSAKEALFGRDDGLNSLCCVVAGALRLGSINPQDGTHRLTLYVEPYQWFGEVSLIDRLPRAMQAVADTHSVVMVVARAAIEEWLDAHPLHWRDVARLACSKLRLMTATLEDSASLTLQQRLARRLLFASVNPGQGAPAGLRRRVRLPQDHLAQMLGVSRQTVNKALRELERQGVLALHYAEIEVLQVEGLMQRAGALEPQWSAVLAEAGAWGAGAHPGQASASAARAHANLSGGPTGFGSG